MDMCRGCVAGNTGNSECGEVINATTGQTWLDRNLGATRVATSSTDAAAIGDYYQWGRLADGHEIRTSSVVRTFSSSDVPGHGNFIEPSTSNDWRVPQNDNLWQGVDGINNPCPTGFRIPTEAEFVAEVGSWDSNNPAGAFGSPLKLTVGGLRYSGGGFGWEATGFYWTSTVVVYQTGDNSSNFLFIHDTAYTTADSRSRAFNVRCIKQ